VWHARARSIGKARVSCSAPGETQIYRSVLTVSAPWRTRPSWFACEWHHRLARFPTQSDAEPRSEGAVARVGVGRIHWKFDGLTEEGRQAQLSPKVRCRESSTAVRALASAFKTRKIKKKYRGARFVRNRIDRKTPPDHRRAAGGLKAHLLVDPPFVSGPFARFVKKNEPRAASRERARGSSPRSTRASRGNPSGTTSRP